MRLLLPPRIRAFHAALAPRMCFLPSRWQQARLEKDDYYLILLESPLPTPVSSSSSLSLSSTFNNTSTLLPKPAPSIIFGSRLMGPSAVKHEAKEGRPQEPDNCCMSGCVNCVWDTYREEVEEWAARKREAQDRAHDDAIEGKREDVGLSGEDENGVRELFEQVPVGIREFMAMEKRLREKEERSKKGGVR